MPNPMSSFLQVSSALNLALGVAALAMLVYALVDCARKPSGAFVATGNQTKKLWLIILGIGTAVCVIQVFSPLNMFSMAAVVAAGIYLTRVKPAVGPARRNTSEGPYGPW